MTSQIPTDTSVETPAVNEKEINFRKLEQRLKHEQDARKQAEERAEAAERAAREREKVSRLNTQDDDDDDEPYVDRKKLKKELGRFGEQTKQEIDKQVEERVQRALDQERKNSYLRDNPDFNKVMTEEMLEKFSDKYPRLTENILRMPEGFERQKLVYENIKAMGFDKPEQKGPSIQDKVDANRRGPYYQPTGVGAPPFSSPETAGYASQKKDYSRSEMEQAYAKMQELKDRLRAG